MLAAFAASPFTRAVCSVVIAALAVPRAALIVVTWLDNDDVSVLRTVCSTLMADCCA